MKIKQLNYSGDIRDVVDKINEIINCLNDSFITDEPDTAISTFVTGLCTSDDTISNVASSVSIKGGAKCPHCGESYYEEMWSTSTAVYYPPIYKDGVNINPDRNKTTTHCRCLNCNTDFDI